MSFSRAKRFTEPKGSAGAASASTFKARAAPTQQSEKLRHKMAELLQQLEDRDHVISQLRVSNDKLSARVGQLEGLLRDTPATTANTALSRHLGPGEGAAESTTERRLTKDLEELKEEVRVFVDAVELESSYGAAAQQDRDDEEEIVKPERRCGVPPVERLKGASMGLQQKDHMEVSTLQKRFEDACAEARRWRNDYELLQARVAPFQERNLQQMKPIQKLELDPTYQTPVAAPILCMQPFN